MRRALLLFILGVTALLAQAQNLLENGDFEQGEQPACWAQGDLAVGWQSSKVVSGALINHSPDYFDDNVNFFATASCDAPTGQSVGEPKFISGAKSGNRYMGLGAYELIQQHIPEPTPGGKYYTLSMYIAPNYEPADGLWNGGTGRLKVGLARNRVEYRSGDENQQCMDHYIEYQAGPMQEIRVLGTLDLNINMFDSPSSRKRVSFSFEAPNSVIGDFDWLFIDVEIPNYSAPATPDLNACIGDYIYIDVTANA